MSVNLMAPIENARENASQVETSWTTGHIRVLDGLRGCAVIAVMLYHFTAPEMTYRATGLVGHLQSLMGAGWCGVDLFFVLSGFLITGILLDAKGSSTYFRSFYVRRVLRIFPLYYGVIALVALARLSPTVSDFFGFSDIKASLGWLAIYLSNFVMAFRHDKTVFGPMGHFWSLAVEEHFYMVWPAVVWFCTRRQLCVVCVLFAGGALIARIGLALTAHSPRVMDITYMATFCRVDGLAMGALLALIVRSRLKVNYVRQWTWGLGIASLIFVLGLGLRSNGGGFSHYGRAMNTAGFTMFAILFTSIIALMISAPTVSIARRLLELKPLMSVGKYSFAMYILHLTCARPFSRMFPIEPIAQLLHSRNLSLLVFALLATTTTYALAWLSWNAYEKHFLRLKRLFPY